MATPKEETLALCEEALELRDKLKEIRIHVKDIIEKAMIIGEKDIEEKARDILTATYVDEGPARETKALLLRSWADLDRKKRWRHKKLFEQGKIPQPQKPIAYVTQNRTKMPLPIEIEMAQAEDELNDDDKNTLRNYNQGKDYL